MSDVVADLEALELTNVEVSGGASKLGVKLPRPKDAVRVRIGAGPSDIGPGPSGRRPCPVRVGGGASTLAIDDSSVEAAGGTTDRRSPDSDEAQSRYDIEIGAGASKATIRT